MDQNCVISVFLTKNALLSIFSARILKNYCHIWNQHPKIFLFAKFHEKAKLHKFGTRNALFGYVSDRILKNYCQIWNQPHRIFLIAKFREKTKIHTFGTKNAWYAFFDQKLLISVFLSKKYTKTIAIFEISTLKFVYM